MIATGDREDINPSELASVVPGFCTTLVSLVVQRPVSTETSSVGFVSFSPASIQPLADRLQLGAE